MTHIATEFTVDCFRVLHRSEVREQASPQINN
jgi:hypothetical protein